jgi:hypothetical protein
MEIPVIYKHISKSIVYFFLVWLGFITSCKKESAVIPNRPPIARAGDDRIISLTSCSEFGIAELNGTATSDPDRDVLSYRWDKIYGPGGIVESRFSSKTTVENILPGMSAYQLTVSDEHASYSTDTVLIKVIGKTTEYNLDIMFECDLSFQRFDCYCYDLSSPQCCTISEIRGYGFFPPLGILMIRTKGISGPISTGSQIVGNIEIVSNNFNNTFIEGSIDANIWNMNESGEGFLNGNFNLQKASVEVCDSNIIKSLQPLSLTGILEPTVKRATLRVVGKVYF